MNWQQINTDNLLSNKMISDDLATFSCPDYFMSNLHSVPEDAMKYMREYLCSSADNELPFSGFSELQMKALYSGTGSKPTRPIFCPYPENTAATGYGAPSDVYELVNGYVNPSELAGVPFYFPCDSTGNMIHDAFMSNYLMPKEEVISTEPYCPYMIMECQHAERDTSPQVIKMEEANESHSLMNYEASTSNVAPRSFSRKYRRWSKAAESESNRRTVINEKMQALQELLPASLKAKQGNQEAIVDNALAHVKYLQLQLKELSRSRLGGESLSTPLSFLEGYGHYHPHEEMTRVPLEEVIGSLIEENQATALRLFESKGLHMMPMTSIDALRCSE